MKPVDMRLFAKSCPDCKGLAEIGDCATATIASILELPYEEVPLFVHAAHGWAGWFQEWLAKRGLTADVIGWGAREKLPSGAVYASGVSPRGFHHAVVWEGGANGRVVHDPHPSRAGLVGDPEYFWVIRPADEVCGSCGRGRHKP